MPAPRGLVQKLDQRLHRTGLLPRRGRLLVGVSGGADSVALLRLLHAINQSNYWNWKLVVGHVEHGIRGRASAADAKFVKSLAKQLKLPTCERKLKLGREASEDVARQARLSAFAAMVKRQRCYGVVLAHHADDQAETVLMRMMRGTGIEGLAAMRAETRIEGLRVLRPLLEVRREELRAYLTVLGQRWSEDGTNTDGRYLRNRVRAEVLPVLEQVWPQAVPALCRLAAVAGEEHVVVAEAAVALRKKSGRLSRETLRGAPVAVAAEVLRRAVEHAGGSVEQATFERIREVLAMVRRREGGKVLQVGGGIVVEVRKDAVTVRRER